MSKINQLIQNLCPAGVEYKKLENVLIIKNGRDYKQFGDGNIPVYGSGGIMTYIDSISFCFAYLIYSSSCSSHFDKSMMSYAVSH